MDRYSKIVLTLIAGSLLAIAVQNFTGRAAAQFSCGTALEPCYIRTVSGWNNALEVRIISR